MSDVGFVIAGFTGILGGFAVYAATLVARLRRVQREAAAMRAQAGGAGDPAGHSDPPASGAE